MGLMYLRYLEADLTALKTYLHKIAVISHNEVNFLYSKSNPKSPISEQVIKMAASSTKPCFNNQNMKRYRLVEPHRFDKL